MPIAPSLSRSFASRGLVVLALLALLSALPGGLAGCGGRSGSGDEVWIIGLDGADWDILDPLLARGELPNLARLKREGAWGTLVSEEPMLSPILWTTIATGKSPDLHGITWFMSETPTGEKIPVSSTDRPVRAVWEIASERGLPVGVVGWWATWPADPLQGFLVSDYIGGRSIGLSGRDIETTGRTWPAGLEQRIARLLPDPAAVTPASLAQYVRLSAAELAARAEEDPADSPVAALRQALATAESYTAISVRLLREKRPRFFAVYYEGTDAVQHLFLPYAPPRLPWVNDADYAAYGEVVTAYWREQDRRVGRLLAERGPRTTVLIVSDHGFRQAGERLKQVRFELETADLDHLPEGVYIVHGPRVARPGPGAGVSLYDVAPTVLALLGLPVAQDMRGQPIAAVTPPGGAAPARVATYETSPRPRAEPVRADPAAAAAMEKKLRTLGYVAGGDGAGGGMEISVGAEQKVNLAIVLRKQRRYAEAESLLVAVLRQRPGDLMARINLARTYGEAGRLPDATALLRDIVREHPDDRRNHADLALAYALQGRPADALAVYEAGLARWEDWAVGLAGKGRALHDLKRDAEALAAIERALALDPRCVEAHAAHGAVLLAVGRHAEAAEAFEQVLTLSPRNANAALALADLKKQGGDEAGAAAVLRRISQQGGDDPRLQARLGAEALQQGRVQEALAQLGRAAQALPEDVKCQADYGLALAMSGDLAGAASVFERVVELDPSSAPARGQLGSFYAQLGRLPEAERHLEAAVKAAPADARLHVNLGTIYHVSGRLADAEREYREATRLAPRAGRNFLMLAMVQRDQGREDLARETFARAQQLDPTLTWPELPGPGGGR